MSHLKHISGEGHPRFWKTCHNTSVRIYNTGFNLLRLRDAYMFRQSIHYRFISWFIAWSVPSHYPNQYSTVVGWTLRNKFQRNCERNSYIFIQWNASVKWRPFLLGLNVLSIRDTIDHFKCHPCEYIQTKPMLKVWQRIVGHIMYGTYEMKHYTKTNIAGAMMLRCVGFFSGRKVTTFAVREKKTSWLLLFGYEKH